MRAAICARDCSELDFQMKNYRVEAPSLESTSKQTFLTGISVTGKTIFHQHIIKYTWLGWSGALGGSGWYGMFGIVGMVEMVRMVGTVGLLGCHLYRPDPNRPGPIQPMEIPTQ